ncbi:MAG: RIP metalloprotease RseP [Candidatus Aureabacteria bacterium]|nr:RIP metalloprotease RseP [Candidatus Auribacterota bacterium]
MELIFNIFIFAIFLGVLVFVHELGHFLTAKLLNIYVFEFMIGFPPKLFKIKRKENEYGIGSIPIGGYVKMAGQEDFPGHEDDEIKNIGVKVPEDRKFNRKSIWQRMSVVVAGPLMNFFFGVFVFIALFLLGHQILLGMKENYIGAVLPASPAEKAGLRVGDRIASVNGVKTATFEDIRWQVISKAGDELKISVDRNGLMHDITVTPEKPKGRNPGGIGITPFDFTEIYEVQAGTPAEKAGLLPKDIVLKVDGRYVQLSDFSMLTADRLGKRMELTILRNGKEERVYLAPMPLKCLSGMFVTEDNIVIVYNEDKAGSAIRTGDRIEKFDDIGIEKKNQVTEAISARTKGSKIKLTVSRRIKKKFFGSSEEQIEIESKIGFRGIAGVKTGPAMIYEKYPFGKAVQKGISQSLSTLKMVVGSLALLFSGRVGFDQLQGPVGIFKVTSAVASFGFSSLIKWLGILSMYLAFFNILPLPMLDGGHVLLLLIEKIKGRPISEKYVLIWQKVGLILILFLLVFVTFNDIRLR